MTTELRLRHADGSWREFEVIANNLLDEVAVAGLVLTGRDVTERKNFERQLQQLAFHDALTGDAIMGDLVGSKLIMLPAEIVSFADFKAAFPGGRVLSRDTGHPRDYGRNPYVGYDNIKQQSVPVLGAEGRTAPSNGVCCNAGLERRNAAYPFSQLTQVHVVNDTVGGDPVVVLYQTGTRSALDGPTVADSRDVGAATMFDRRVNGRVLTFSWRTDHVVDDQTDSTCGILGRATDGPLAASRLRLLVSGNHFWFA